MARRFVDRGAKYRAVDQRSGDVQFPPDRLRKLVNGILPDGRITRREGFSIYNGADFAGSQDRHVGAMLGKHTPSSLTTTSVGDDRGKMGGQPYWKTPRSYGLIRWHDDFQPKVTRDWTVEFIVRLGDPNEGLVGYSSAISGEYGVHRESFGDGQSTSATRLTLRKAHGVFVYDQALFRSGPYQIRDEDASVTIDVAQPYSSTATTKNVYNAYFLPALSVAFNKDSGGKVVVEVEWTTVGTYGTTNVYFRGGRNRIRYVTNIAWTEGAYVHVAIAYAASSGTTVDTLALYLNGVLAATKTDISALSGSTRTRFWAGEKEVDDTGAIVTTPLQRDIVLLNECTARGYYASACNPDDVASAAAGGRRRELMPHPASKAIWHGSTSADVVDIDRVWCCSPPRGMGIAELRWWHVARTPSEIAQYALQEVASSSTGLVGYWKCRDGGPILKDHIQFSNRHGQVHMGPPAYLRDSGLIGSFGIRLEDSQYLNLSLPFLSREHVDHLGSALTWAFFFNNENEGISGYTTAGHRIDEQNDFTAQIQFRTPYTFQKKLFSYALGKTASTSTHIYPQDGASTPNDVYMSSSADFIDPFLQTLFSIEAWPFGEAGNEWWVTPQNVKKRIPLLRVLLDEQGYVRVEMYGRGTISSTPRAVLHVLKSSVALSADTVYTVSVVLKRKSLATGGAAFLQLYINDSFDSELTLTESDLFYIHLPEYEITIGCTGANDATWLVWNNGPKSKEVHFGKFNDPYATAPGFFTLGAFRLWGAALSPSEIANTYNKKLSDVDYAASLLVNLEVDAVYGLELPSKARYPAVFRLGFLSFDEGLNPYNSDYPPAATIAKRALDIPLSWNGEDALGYVSLISSFNRGGVSGRTLSRCTGLGSYRSVMKPVGGLLAVQDSVLRFDDGYTGDFKDVMISTGGLLDDFYVSDYWSMSVVADQVVLTAAGGTPKVFDGQIARPGGLRRTGQPRFSVRVFSSSVVNGRWQKGAWYGLVIAYVDQADNIVHVMPRITFKVSNATDVVGIRGLPPHPDPRVTGIQIYLTGPKLDAMTAYRAPVSLARHTTFDVKGSWWDGSTYTAANIIVSHDTYPAILDEQITPMPVCAYSTSYNDRLVMAGDPALPDAVYWSAPGSPERFDVVADRVILEDASGDRITGLVTAFDSVVIFKENSVWRMSETAPGVMTPVKITDSLGCIAPRSIKVVSDPNTGSVGVVFWSKLGPYWFDGVKFAYLGDAVESLYGRGRFEFIQDPTLISTIHVADSSLLLFCYGSGQDPAVLDKALCFDYRNGIWSEFSGMIGGVSMTAMVRHTDRAVYSMGGTTDLAVDVAKSSLMVLFAGNNGRIYRWGAFGSAHDWINYDGLPDGVTGIGDELTLTGGSSSNMTFAAGTLPSSGLEGLWVTVYKSDYSQYGLFRIIGHDDSTIYYDTSLAPSYTPAAGDKARIGLPFLEAETGWDSLDAPHLTKELIESYVWGEQQWRLQLLSDWEAIPTVRTWESLNLSSQSFDRVQWNRLLKNAKLLMLSGDLDARLDYMTHTVNYLQESSD